MTTACANNSGGQKPQLETSYFQHREHRLAYVHSASTHSEASVSVIFCGGFKSNMEGTKALALETYCKQQNFSYTRFDYSGHGRSDGEFINGAIDSWLDDTLCIFDNIVSPDDTEQTATKVIVIGSSMGAWIAVLLAQRRAARIAGLITLAAAPDFTETLLRPSLSEQQRAQLDAGHVIELPSDYDDGSSYPISPHLIENSRKCCVLNQPIQLNIPVHLLHGTSDPDVPYQQSIRLMEALHSKDTVLTLIKNSDHRLSSESDLHIIRSTLQSMIDGKLSKVCS